MGHGTTSCGGHQLRRSEMVEYPERFRAIPQCVSSMQRWVSGSSRYMLARFSDPRIVPSPKPCRALSIGSPLSVLTCKLYKSSDSLIASRHCIKTALYLTNITNHDVDWTYGQVNPKTLQPINPAPPPKTPNQQSSSS